MSEPRVKWRPLRRAVWHCRLWLGHRIIRVGMRVRGDQSLLVEYDRRVEEWTRERDYAHESELPTMRDMMGILPNLRRFEEPE